MLFKNVCTIDIECTIAVCVQSHLLIVLPTIQLAIGRCVYCVFPVSQTANFHTYQLSPNSPTLTSNLPVFVYTVQRKNVLHTRFYFLKCIKYLLQWTCTFKTCLKTKLMSHKIKEMFAFESYCLSDTFRGHILVP